MKIQGKNEVLSENLMKQMDEGFRKLKETMDSGFKKLSETLSLSLIHI